MAVGVAGEVELVEGDAGGVVEIDDRHGAFPLAGGREAPAQQDARLEGRPGLEPQGDGDELGLVRAISSQRAGKGARASHGSSAAGTRRVLPLRAWARSTGLSFSTSSKRGLRQDGLFDIL